MNTFSAKRKLSVIWGILALSLGAPQAFAEATTEQCLDAASAIDLAICGDDTLNAADAELDRLLHEAKTLGIRVEVEQAEWLKAVRNACDGMECISTAYVARIAQLETKIADAAARQAAALQMRVYSASFDCKAPSSQVESLICGDETLAAADAELARAVKQKSSRNPGLAEGQATWRARVRDQCSNAECLSQAYLDRLGVIEGMQAPITLRAVAKDPKAAATTVLKRQIGQETWIYLFWTFVAFMAFILILGANDAVVICYDHADFLWAASPLLFVVIGLLIAATFPKDESGDTVRAFVTIAAAAMCFVAFVKTFLNAIKYNKSVSVGVMVGVFKVMLGLLAILILFGSMNRTSRSGRGQSAGAVATLMLLALLFWLYRTVINGRSVYASKNWQMAMP